MQSEGLASRSQLYFEDPPQPIESASLEMGPEHPSHPPSPPPRCQNPKSHRPRSWGASRRSSPRAQSIPPSTLLPVFLSPDWLRARTAACLPINLQARGGAGQRPQTPVPLRGPQAVRAAGSGPVGAGRFCLRCTFHFYRSRTAAILPQSVANNGGRPSPRLPVSQVPLLGMCLSLCVPVAAWKWTEAQRVSKRGSPCAARLPAAPGLCKAYF